MTLQNRQRRLRINARLLTALAHRAAALSGTPQTEVNIVLVRDRAMAKLNAAYHATAGPTDVLSFDYGATGELIISTDHAVSQGRRFGQPAARELILYMAHGLLHLAGHDDRAAGPRRRMRAAERRVLRRLAAEFDLATVARVDRRRRAA